MVAQHYRWDFYGLSTDSKPDATNPKVANGSTYYEADTSKLYVWYKDQWYEKASTGGGGSEAGAMKVLSSEDYNFPEDNPDGIASWLLPSSVYTTEYGTKVYYSKTSNYNYNYPMVIIPVSVKTNGNETRVVFFSFDANHIGYQDTVDGADAGFSKF